MDEIQRYSFSELASLVEKWRYSYNNTKPNDSNYITPETVIETFESNCDDWASSSILKTQQVEDEINIYSDALLLYSAYLFKADSQCEKADDLQKHIRNYENEVKKASYLAPLYTNLALAYISSGDNTADINSYVKECKINDAVKKATYYDLKTSFFANYSNFSFYSFRPCSKYLFESLANETLSITSPQYFNDIFDTPILTYYNSNSAFYAKRAEIIQQCIKVACFVRYYHLNPFKQKKKRHIGDEFLNELMWAHYADSHKGICIKYRFENNPQKKGKYCFSFMDDIEYNSRPFSYKKNGEIIPYTYPANKKDGFFKKGTAWKYECETRLINFNFNGTPGYDSIDIPNAVKEIYFGVQCSDTDKKIIISLLNGKAVNFYEMEMDTSRYGKLKAKKMNEKRLKQFS